MGRGRAGRCSAGVRAPDELLMADASLVAAPPCRWRASQPPTNRPQPAPTGTGPPNCRIQIRPNRRTAPTAAPQDDTEMRLMPGDEFKLRHRSPGSRVTAWEALGVVVQFDATEEVCLELRTNVRPTGFTNARRSWLSSLPLFSHIFFILEMLQSEALHPFGCALVVSMFRSKTAGKSLRGVGRAGRGCPGAECCWGGVEGRAPPEACPRASAPPTRSPPHIHPIHTHVRHPTPRAPSAGRARGLHHRLQCGLCVEVDQLRPHAGACCACCARCARWRAGRAARAWGRAGRAARAARAAWGGGGGVLALCAVRAVHALSTGSSRAGKVRVGTRG
jgi:hypothetical protein